MSPPGGQSSALGTLLSFAFAQSCRGSCGPGGDARYQSPSPPDSAKHFRSKTCLTFLENSPGWRPVLPPEQPYRRAGQVGPSRLQGQRALSHRRMGPTPSRSQVTSRHSPGTFCLFILFTGFSRQEYCNGLPFPPPADHHLSELSTVTRPSWVALHGMAHSFIKFCSPFQHNKAVIMETEGGNRGQDA